MNRKLIAGLLISLPVFTQAADCSRSKIAEVLEPASTNKKSVLINCNLTLSSSNLVTKQLIFSGKGSSNTTLDCNGARIHHTSGVHSSGDDMLMIRSIKQGSSWSRPENISVKNCKIKGSVRIYGMGKNGEASEVRASSVSPGHTLRARNAAPKNVGFYNMTIEGISRIPLYLSPGTTYFTMDQSEIKGSTSSTAIYMGAESGYNTIKNSYIHPKTRSRELIAIDASAFNTLENNRFSSLNNGGIYLYRNCGEGGTVRHQTPTGNKITGNYFYYNTYSGNDPAIYLGSRNGNRSYCGYDKHHNIAGTSSASDLDFATNNFIYRNQIRKLSYQKMIRVGRPSTDINNQIKENMTVSEFGPRNDVTLVPFECKVSGNNSGCRKYVHCPRDKNAVAARAGCNLEYGSVSQSQLNTIPWGRLHVVKASDNVHAGTCYIGGDELSSGSVITDDLPDSGAVFIGCKEHDKNGGECHIKGELICL